MHVPSQYSNDSGWCRLLLGMLLLGMHVPPQYSNGSAWGAV